MIIVVVLRNIVTTEKEQGVTGEPPVFTANNAGLTAAHLLL
jgi:hypothetical protein